MNRAREIRPRGNHDSAAAGFSALIDCAPEGGGAVGLAGAFSAEAVEMERSVWKARWFDAFENRRHHGFPRTRRGLPPDKPRRNGNRHSTQNKLLNELASCCHLGSFLPRPDNPCSIV